MSKRTKLKLRNMKLFVSKYILNGRYVVRNILAIIIAITFVALTIGTVKLVQMNVGNGEEVVETAVEENVLVVTADAPKFEIQTDADKVKGSITINEKENTPITVSGTKSESGENLTVTVEHNAIAVGTGTDNAENIKLNEGESQDGRNE